MGVDDGDAADGAATTTHVLDIQSDWQTTADDSFWVSSSDRVVLLNPDPIAGADVVLYSASPTVIHSVHKTNRGIASSPYHITGQSRYGLTIASELYSTTFYTPHAQTSMQTQLYAVSTSPNGAFVGVGGADGLFHLTQIPTHTSLHLAGHVADVTHVAFFPSSLVALTGSTDFSLRIWSLQSFKCGAVLRGHRGAICGIGILGRGRNVVSCAHDRLVKLWHCGTSYSFRDWALSSTPRCLNVTSALPREPHDLVEPLGIEPNNMEFETSSTWLVVGTDAGCTVLDARAPTPVTLLPHSAAVTSCATKSLDSATLLITGTEHGVVSSYDMRYEKYAGHAAPIPGQLISFV
ncbi:hypothetical protein, variant 1 [Aphanomyces invadans]|uniref:Uncharacterized protein n=1 Tax=Aphanomyces invadans TaxID=157072 RepID=A0A024TI71_9STRA|nr:hypothetical protein, variant 1 [Aphanomyces invadans]ETV93753.1 hypothetical protein, variant 1 [Aphanomyces invadans]|eukprot:XP_008877561.1 hypothetical protein, variant 1 [Aphanomyces invadans]